MHTKIISNTVTNTVVLGEGNYGTHLTITSTGAVRPTAAGASGITASVYLNDVHIHNEGMIEGGDGQGDGIARDLAGGAGIELGSGTINNAGLIEGGAGGYASGVYGAGGADQAGNDEGGVVFGGAGVMINYGVVNAGGYASVGVEFKAGGKLENFGSISGAGGYYGTLGGGPGGTGVVLGGSGVSSNHGTITGGDGGGQEEGNGGAGGLGVMLGAGASLGNQGVITGGAGNFSFDYEGGSGGDGVHVTTGASLTNAGSIIGGYGGSTGVGDAAGSGGVGVDVAAAARLINHGSISGGGAGSGDYGSAIAGGIGVLVAYGAMVGNYGSIAGGAGGYSFDGQSAVGAAGVYIVTGDTLTNHGTIAGGTGAYGRDYGRSHYTYGGAGVYLAGGTLIAMGGVIAGGAADSKIDGVQGDAVQFGSAAATLVVYSKAVFSGDIVANADVQDVLVLDGTSKGTLSGFGTTITGFTNINEAANAHWTLDGTISGTGVLSIGTGASLHLDGTVSIASVAFAKGGQESLTLANPTNVTSLISGFGTGDTIDLAAIKAASLSYQAGTLTLLDANNVPLDKFSFAGSYNQSDFAIKLYGGGTEVEFAGKAVTNPAGHLPDFLPRDVNPWHFAGGIELGAHAALVSGDRMPVPGNDYADLYKWHAISAK